MHLLFVCTGNICRSPLAERLTVAFAAGLGAPDLTGSSAGVGALVGQGMDVDAAAVLRSLGGSDDGFRARAFVPAMAEGADLVLTMTGAQRQLVLERAPRALRRTFTLREAAAVLELVPADELPTGGTAHERGVALVAALARRRNEWRGRDVDVEDPYRQPSEVHAEIGREISRSLTPLLEAMAGMPAAQT